MGFLQDRTYLIITKWAYPFGGGEEFMYQTMKWAYDLGMKAYWISFANANNENFTEFLVEDIGFGKLIKVPGGLDENIVEAWVRLINPDICHHQGGIREDIYNGTSKTRVPLLTGFHFWTGAFILDTEVKNRDILLNYDKHQTHPELTKLYGKQFIHYYSVTPFVAECIQKVTGYDVPDNIYSSSSIEKCYLEDLDILENKYVLIINIHKLKGGDILLHLLRNCKNIPFMAVPTEYHSEGLDKLIMDEVAIRDADPEAAEFIVEDRAPNPTIFYQQTRILLAPSLVDETFCRVVNEGMMNGIPIMTTGQGNIDYLIGHGEYGIKLDPNNPDDWVKALNDIYFDDDKLLEWSNKSKKGYELYSEDKASSLFKDLTTKIIKDSKEMNIMIFSPWCDQGLGIQSRNYANILRQTGYNVFIFGVKPYNKDTCIELQKNPKEWILDGVTVEYSHNDREKVKDSELIKFVQKHNIGKCLLPETCWFRVFQVAQLMKKQNVKCYAIPNIEIVRRDEVFKHKYFHKILCNNMQCMNIFNNFGIMKTHYIGYGTKNKLITMKKKIVKDTVKFLFIGGMNAFSRKHVLSICEGFALAYKDYPNMELTCTIQMTNNLEAESKKRIEEFIKHPGMNIIQGHLAYKDILGFYYDHHISIQVSKHEGLGLGFYEGLGTGTPIITLDTPPHNELILDEVNGWIIDCYHKPMTDNPQGLFGSAYFDPEKLASKIKYIVKKWPESFNKIQKSLKKDFNSRLHINVFKKKFLESIQT